MFNKLFLEYTVNDIERLKDETFVGKSISFEVRVIDNILKHSQMKTVTGKVTEMYPYIFRMDDGRTYQWSEYLLGYKY